MDDPYEKCPQFETQNFILRLVDKTDAEALLECYSDINAQKYFNSDNCTSDFKYKTIDEMNECIDFWLLAYKNKWFIRFSIINKLMKKAVGTIEIFGGSFGVLRIDIKSEYETIEYLKEAIEISVNNFFELLNIENIIIKAIPEATERIKALMEYGFTSYPKEMEPSRKYYYIKKIHSCDN
jgi:RimJ/RimL family protein N-acetyltransferase